VKSEQTIPDGPNPRWLDQAAQDEWQRLEAAGLISSARPEVVAAYCFAYSMWKQLREVVRQLEAAGQETWTNSDGHQQSHPAISIEARLAVDLVDLARALEIDHDHITGHRATRIVVLDEGPPETFP
jgi:phage terminase small subunit